MPVSLTETPPHLPHSRAVVAEFDRHATDYQAHSGVQEAVAQWLAEWIPAAAAALPQSATPAVAGDRLRRDLGPARRTAFPCRCLEFGAGTGHFTRHLLREGLSVHATDAAPAMVALGQQRLPDPRWLLQDAWAPTADHLPESPPLRLIASASLLQWAPAPVAVLQRWAALLPMGGAFLGAWFIKPTLREWHQLTGLPGPVIWRSASDWRSALQEAGWNILSAESRDFPWHYPSSLALLRSLQRSGAAPSPGSRHHQAPPSQLRRLLAAYDRQYHGPAGVRATWTALRVLAQK